MSRGKRKRFRRIRGGFQYVCGASVRYVWFTGAVHNALVLEHTECVELWHDSQCTATVAFICVPWANLEFLHLCCSRRLRGAAELWQSFRNYTASEPLSCNLPALCDFRWTNDTIFACNFSSRGGIVNPRESDCSVNFTIGTRVGSNIANSHVQCNFWYNRDRYTMTLLIKSLSEIYMWDYF